MTPRGLGGCGTQCPLSLPHPARAPPVRLPAGPATSRPGSVRGRGRLRPRRQRQGLPRAPAPPAGQAPGPPPRTREPRRRRTGGGSPGLTGGPEPPLPRRGRPSGARGASPPLTHPSPVRRLLRRLLRLLLPPLGRGSGSARRRRRWPRERGASGTRTHAARRPRPSRAPRPSSALGLKEPLRKGCEPAGKRGEFLRSRGSRIGKEEGATDSGGIEFGGNAATAQVLPEQLLGARQCCKAGGEEAAARVQLGF